MSKQLTISSTFSVLAMAALALAMNFGAPSDGGARSAATAKGALVSVLLRG